ncbi:Trehalase [Citrus sinensis]|uniref:probable trehalase isoform X1 n=1 Tax=Citrus sinensis TaxID=2711 RepID=UPI0021915036|nr:probable trehalase isoform X1 [Citrus sinensis]KAH9685214.1 Trehalase [Citrus sinensis]
MCMASFHSRSSNSNGNHPASSFSLLLLFLLLASVSASETVPKAMSKPATGNFDRGPVVPTNPLVTFLERVQETALATFGQKDFDPKLYVDLSLKSNLSTTVTAFHKLPRNATGSVSIPDFKEFMHEYFDGAGNDLVYAEPPDFVPEPDGFLPKVKNPQVRAWALEVHALWKNLSRRVSCSVSERPEFHTLLPLPGPVVIPGSRFREVYYWDSYWVIRGLLASKMYKTAKAIVTNLIYLIDTYGYVLNGARAYYTNRSQPPLLSAMVYDIYNRTGDSDLVKKALPALLKEHQFWNSGIHKVNVQDNRGRNHTLSRYYAMWNKPRPESSTTDKVHASKLLNASEKEQFYRELASVAESGWDFSTRWMRNTSDFTTLAITSILPVDLNIFILKMELDIVSMAQIVGDNKTVESFLKSAQARKEAIDSVFWNEENGQWLDYWISNGTGSQECQRWKASNQNNNAFASNFVPIWIDLFNSDTCIVEKVRKSFQSSGLLGAAGIATSLTRSEEQWDFPNGWAPLQHMIVEGLGKSGSQEAKSMAQDIAMRWINTNYVAYKETGAMHEKYNVEKCGDIGGGGEYIPQTGFGWSNGVVLAFLEEFGWPADLKIGCNGVLL